MHALMRTPATGRFTAVRRLAGLAALVFPLLGAASSLAVSPTSLTFSPDDIAQGLVLHNRGGEAFRAQVRVFAWDQPEGDDRLEPTDRLVASPPFVTIPPGEQQFVRIVRRHAGNSEEPREEAFRLLVDELPINEEAPPPSTVTQAPSAGLRFKLRYSIPVFVNTPSDDRAAVRWSTTGPAAEILRVTATNTGSTRAQIADLRVLNAEGASAATQDGLVGYVLPGVTRTWSLPWPTSAEIPAEIDARINGERRSQSLSARDPAD